MENEIKIPIIKQSTDYTCGPASLLSILRASGVKGLSEKRLMMELGTDKQDGTQIMVIVKVAKKYGLKATMKTDMCIGDIGKGIGGGSMFIVNHQEMRKGHGSWKETWKNGHYSVVSGIDDRYIWLMDPWTGKIERIGHKKFMNMWHDEDKGIRTNGVAIIFRKKRK